MCVCAKESERESGLTIPDASSVVENKVQKRCTGVKALLSVTLVVSGHSHKKIKILVVMIHKSIVCKSFIGFFPKINLIIDYNCI